MFQFLCISAAIVIGLISIKTKDQRDVSGSHLSLDWKKGNKAFKNLLPSSNFHRKSLTKYVNMQELAALEF